eukprot:UN04936
MIYILKIFYILEFFFSFKGFSCITVTIVSTSNISRYFDSHKLFTDPKYNFPYPFSWS